MPTSPTLSEQLATLGVHLPAWPEEPEDGGATGDWIQRGQAYAEGVGLWRAQLRNAPESTQGMVDQLLRHLHDIGEVGVWDQLVYGAIKPEMQGSPDEERWQACTKLIRSSALTPAQLLGMALELAREQRLVVAIDVLKSLLNEHPVINEQEQMLLCAELVAAINTTQLIDDARSDQEGLDRAIALHEQMAGLIAIAASQQASKYKCATHPRTPPLSSKLDAFIDSQRRCPNEVNKRSWGELLLNAFSTSDPRTPNLLLVESRSLPRSGHHFLKHLLDQALGENFSYCEGYQEPGCCEKSPCSALSYWHYARKSNRPHLRLVKSHDFSFKDATFEPINGMIRLIQIRKPFDLLASWLELQQLELNQELLAQSNISWKRIMLFHEKQLLEDAWHLIDDHGSVMAANDASTWLEAKSSYVKAFLEKWLPIAEVFPFGEPVKKGNFLLGYKYLNKGEEILQSLGIIARNTQELPKFHSRSSDVTRRKSQRVTDLLQTQINLLDKIDAMTMEDFPGLIGHI